MSVIIVILKQSLLFSRFLAQRYEDSQIPANSFNETPIYLYETASIWKYMVLHPKKIGVSYTF